MMDMSSYLFRSARFRAEEMIAYEILKSIFEMGDDLSVIAFDQDRKDIEPAVRVSSSLIA